MNEIIHEQSIRQNRSVPWFTFVLIALVFFLAHHRFDVSTLENWSSLNLADEKAKGAQVMTGSPMRRVIFPALGIWGTLLLMYARRNVLNINGLLGVAVLFYLVWAVLSVAWAEVLPPLTARRLVILALLCFAAGGVAARFSAHDFVMFALFVTMAFLFIGTLAEIVNGTFKPWVSGYRFIGTSIHPNAQGSNCGLAVLASFAALHDAKRDRLFFVLVASLCLFGLVLTGSRAGVFSTGIALGVYWAMVLSKARKAAFLFSAVMLVCFLFILFGDAFLGGIWKGVLLGRTNAEDTSTLVGRIPLWMQLIDYVSKRPFHGYGYAGFWTPKHITQVSMSQGWAIESAHSNYFELLLELGIVGFSVFIVILISGAWRAFSHARREENASYAFMGAVLVLSALNGFLISFITFPLFFTFFFMSVLAHLGFVRTNEWKHNHGGTK